MKTRGRVAGLLLGLGLLAGAASWSPVTVPAGWPLPAYAYRGNRPTAAGFALGRRLFYEPALSRDGSTSCASCHGPTAAFAHNDHRLSHGIGGRTGRRNAPTLQNLAWSTSLHWDGGVSNLEVQAVSPISHPDEMDLPLRQAEARLNAMPRYRARFARAFGGDSVVTGQRLLQALAQFTGALVSSNAKYDKYVRHELGGGLSPAELSGLALFERHCASCHPAPLFTTGGFANNGLPPDSILRDAGRAAVTGLAADSFRFKVPTLRNVEFSGPYMHDGRFRTLHQAIQHYTSGTIRLSRTLAPQLRRPVVLSVDEQRDLLLFLFTLSDPQFLRDPRWQYQPDDVD